MTSRFDLALLRSLFAEGPARSPRARALLPRKPFISLTRVIVTRVTSVTETRVTRDNVACAPSVTVTRVSLTT